MIIRNLWKRLKKFKRRTPGSEKSRISSENDRVMKIVPEKTGEALPERKTSDETIIQMAESTAGGKVQQSELKETNPDTSGEEAKKEEAAHEKEEHEGQ